jgi:hypothetical protein
VSYNASAVKIYNARSSLARFENKNIFTYFQKTLQPFMYSAGVVAVNSKVVGLAPVFTCDYGIVSYCRKTVCPNSFTTLPNVLIFLNYIFLLNIADINIKAEK